LALNSKNYQVPSSLKKNATAFIKIIFLILDK
jgi:hypothetical protein